MQASETTEVEKKYYTTAALKDELTKQLSSTIETKSDSENNDIDRYYKYHQYAKKLLYKINLFIPSPVFEINTTDLPQEFQEELKLLDEETLNEVVVDAISRIYECINFEYFHTSGIRGKIRWQFV